MAESQSHAAATSSADPISAPGATEPPSGHAARTSSGRAERRALLVGRAVCTRDCGPAGNEHLGGRLPQCGQEAEAGARRRPCAGHSEAHLRGTDRALGFLWK